MVGCQSFWRAYDILFDLGIVSGIMGTMGRDADGEHLLPLYSMALGIGLCVKWLDGMCIFPGRFCFFFVVDARCGRTSQEELLIFLSLVLFYRLWDHRIHLGIECTYLHCHIRFKAIAFPRHCNKDVNTHEIDVNGFERKFAHQDSLLFSRATRRKEKRILGCVV
jgi:hypothetical protein